MITIDFASAADLPQIHDLHIQTLGDSFSESASSKLRAACAYDSSLHLVARGQSGIVGSIEFRNVRLEGVGFETEHKIAYLGPLVTSRKYQGMGLGSKLMDLGLSLVQSKGYTVVFLVGHAEYYSRFGFRNVRPLNISLPDDRDGDRLLVKMLGRPLALPVYARIVPLKDENISFLPVRSTSILSQTGKQPWRESAA